MTPRRRAIRPGYYQVGRLLRLMLVGVWLSFAMTPAAQVHAQQHAQVHVPLEIEEPPFSYLETEDDNRVSRLLADLRSGELELKYTRERGYLESLLAALDIPVASQTLVFSKTSMQSQHISRRNPRAIYFNDDTYVGWIRGSSLMEISTNDSNLGAVFYTLEMTPGRPQFARRDYECLACHATTMTQNVPGHTLRSVFPDYDGQVNSRLKSFVTDDSSPFEERWGGWYVTGTHGNAKHMGNTYLRGHQLDQANNGNRLNLRDEFETDAYLLPTSDIVALMVMEHQTQMQNTFTRANFSIRQLLYENGGREPSGEALQEWCMQLESLAKEIVERLLFCSEAALPAPVRGSSEFQEAFVARGPSDTQGRSLREFDLQTRLFKYPCSYLIYSEAFATLTPVLRNEVLMQLYAVLSGEDQSPEYSHLDEAIRADIFDILRDTKPEWFASDVAR